MRKALRRTACAGAMVLAALVPATVADAAPQPRTSVVAQQVDNVDPHDVEAENTFWGGAGVPQQTGDNRDTGQHDSGQNTGLWGLLGLLGLLGLAGLVRRGPKPGAMAGYPGSGTDEPPVNRYPPAQPSDSPPGA